MSEYLATPLQYLKGVGPRRAADLARAGLVTIEDLLYRFPLRYEDRGRFASIGSRELAQPAVSPRRRRHRSADGALRRSRDARPWRAAADQSSVRDSRRRG